MVLHHIDAKTYEPNAMYKAAQPTDLQHCLMGHATRDITGTAF